MSDLDGLGKLGNLDFSGLKGRSESKPEALKAKRLASIGVSVGEAGADLLSGFAAFLADAAESVRPAKHVAVEVRELTDERLRGLLKPRWPHELLDLGQDEYEAIWEAVYEARSDVRNVIVSREALMRLLVDHGRLISLHEKRGNT